MERTIAFCRQNGSQVYVYNEKNALLFTKIGTLVGYTSATVSVKRGMRTYVYDARGSLKFSRA
ncbi:hypothetical protein P3B99_008950 [Opitutia bacterium KCR 482]|nr:hypothetical protein [Opitutae bacterium KCR 482]MDY5582626.1 hypothetical protein [Candidatus Merdousia sp.]